MNMHNWREGTYVIAGVMGIFLFIVINFIATVLDPAWTFEHSCLSDLGASNEPITAILFTLSCFVSGILLIVFAIGRYRFGNNMNVSAAVFLVGASIGMFGVGVFNSTDALVMHNISAGTFAGCVSMCIVLITLSDALNRDYFVLITGVIIGIVALGTLVASAQNMSEFITVICAAFWFLIQLYKFYKLGVFSKKDDGCAV